MAKTKSKTINKIQEEAKKLRDVLASQGAPVLWKNEASSMDVSLWIPTPSTLLNGLLTYTYDHTKKGIPVGRIIDIVGPPGAGKSTILAHIFKAFQDAGGLSVSLLSEGERCLDRFEVLGGDIRKHLTVPVKDLLDGFLWLLVIMQNKEPGVPMVIGWDTVSSAPDPSFIGVYDAKDRKGIDKILAHSGAGQASRARITRDQIRLITNPVHQNNCTVIMVHQTIERPQAPRSFLDYQPQTSGGRAIPFQSSIRLYVAGGSKWKEKDDAVGIITRVKTFKSKLVMPEREVYIPIRYKTGIDDPEGVIHYLKSSDPPMIKKAGGWNKVNINGEDKSFHKASELSEEELNYLRREVLARLGPK